MGNTNLVSVEWLKAHLNDQDLVLLDASPLKTVSNKETQVTGITIPHSRKFRIKEDFTNVESPFPNTIPSQKQFEKACQKLGINKSSNIVIFDNLGIYASPRAWWLFKVMGHKKVAVLDGGLPEWVRADFETSALGEIKNDFSPGNFEADFDGQYLKTYQDIKNNIIDHQFQIVDARSKGRFEGTADEPRKELQSGCIPHSINIPYKDLLDGFKFKSKDELKLIFQNKLDASKSSVFSCGSGMTACILILAHEWSIGESRKLYDGSWTEWAIKENLLSS